LFVLSLRKQSFGGFIDFWYAESFAAGGKEEANGL